MRGTRRSVMAFVGLSGAALLAFAYARPVTVFEAWGALRLRSSGVRSAHVQAGRYRLRYLEAGSGPPLVLLHGLASHAAQDWGRLIAPLGRRFHVYAPDLPGFGESERPAEADDSIPMQVEAVRAFMQAKGIGRAHVAGLSMGGWIAARLAGESPERVGRLVLVDAAGMRPDAPRFRPRPFSRVTRTACGASWPWCATTPRSRLPSWPATSWPSGFAKSGSSGGRSSPCALAATGSNGTLGRADMPVLVVWGRQDALIPVVYASGLAAEFPHAEVAVLDGCGHIPIADCPEAFDRVFVSFMTAAP